MLFWFHGYKYFKYDNQFDAKRKCVKSQGLCKYPLFYLTMPDEQIGGDFEKTPPIGLLLIRNYYFLTIFLITELSPLLMVTKYKPDGNPSVLTLMLDEDSVLIKTTLPRTLVILTITSD